MDLLYSEKMKGWGVGEILHMQHMPPVRGTDMLGFNEASIQHDESVGLGLTAAELK